MQNIQFCVIRAQNIWLRSFLRWPSISLSAKKEKKNTQPNGMSKKPQNDRR